MTAPAFRACLVAAALISLPIGASTQGPTSAAQLVTLEFRVTDKDRRAVLDLNADEVRVAVDGRERPVRALELRGARAGTLTAPFVTNASRDAGRDVVLAVDEESILPGSIDPVKEALTETVSMLAPTDRVGVLSLHPNGANVPLTTRRAAIESAIAAVRGRAFARENPIELACRTRLALQRLTNFFDKLQRGVTTTVLVFSASLSAPAAASVARVGVEGGCILQPVHFDDFREAAYRAAAQVYGLRVVDPGLTDDPEKAAGLERIAGAADGEFSRLSGTPSDQLRQIVRESAAYYVASFEVDATDRKNPNRAMDVKLRRDGVKARFRREVVIAESAAPVAKSARDMLRVATPFRALPLRATLSSSRNPGEQTMKVVVLFEPDDAATLTSAMVGLFNAQGRLITQWESDPSDLTKRPAMAGLIAPAGNYRVRVAAMDSSGRGGAVDDDVTIDLKAADTLKLSDILLGVPESGSMAPRIQFGPQDAAAVVYLEVYGLTRCSALSGSVDLAATYDGSALIRAPASATQIEQSGGCILYGGFEINTLKPGDYVVRALVSVEGKVAGRLSRTLRKTS